MRRLLWVSFALVTSVTFGVEPQTDTNVVSSAGDAFGITLGPETLGLYSSSSVRGFSPFTAGNVRLDGLYFDQQGSMIDALVTDTRIRVGLSAANFPWPAPSGIVDYMLREPKGDTPELTSILYAGPYASRDIDLDGYMKFPEKGTGIAAGASYHDDAFIPGQTERSASFGILPQWTPSKDLSIRAFWGRANYTEIKPAASIYLQPGQTAPPVPTRFYGTLGVTGKNDSEHAGLLSTAKLDKHWSVRMGVFHSIFDAPLSYQDLYLNTTSNAIADHTLIAEPKQYYGSTSGEIQLAHKIESQFWWQELVFGVRGRSVSAQFGGAAIVDFGTGVLGQVPTNASPSFLFGATSADHIHDYSSGASYTLRWRKRLSLTAAIRRVDYSNENIDPVSGRSVTSTHPWLYDSSVTFLPTSKLIIFGAVTRGLEDSGVAPSNSVNRGEVLDATHSSQEEMGVKYSLASSLSMLASIFDVQKSYFADNESNVFSILGQERHRGVEFSLTGPLTSQLHIVSGVLFMSPEVIATSTPQQPIGARPIGQANRTEQFGLDYRVPGFTSLSFDCLFGEIGNRVASVDNRTRIPAYTYLDLGARYQISLGQYPATLRVQVMNVTNTLNWLVGNDGGLAAIASRRAWAYLIVDL